MASTQYAISYAHASSNCKKKISSTLHIYEVSHQYDFSHDFTSSVKTQITLRMYYKRTIYPICESFDAN